MDLIFFSFYCGIAVSVKYEIGLYVVHLNGKYCSMHYCSMEVTPAVSVVKQTKKIMNVTCQGGRFEGLLAQCG